MLSSSFGEPIMEHRDNQQGYDRMYQQQPPPQVSNYQPPPQGFQPVTGANNN